jgi:hypothetical protein
MPSGLPNTSVGPTPLGSWVSPDTAVRAQVLDHITSLLRTLPWLAGSQSPWNGKQGPT